MSNRNRLTACVYAAAALALGCLSNPASAQNKLPVIPFSQIAGPPLPIENKLPAGFYIRRGAEKATKDDDEIVLVTHGFNGNKTRGVVFTGTITVTGGLILNPRSLYLDKNQQEGYVVKGNVLEFRLFSFDLIDLIAFHAPKGRQVTFTLFADGLPVQSVAFGGKPEWVKGNTFILDTAQ